jgi:hypothetical protein
MEHVALQLNLTDDELRDLSLLARREPLEQLLPEAG